MTARGYFASVNLEEGLLCHGGLDRPDGDRRPRDDLFLVSRRNFEVVPFVVSNPQLSPHLSHHCAVLMQERFVLFVGGWDGRRRSNRVHVLDLRRKEWLEEPKVSVAPPPPVGLSGHTATMVGPDTVAVVGREGGVREQRRFGDVFLLRWAPGENTCRYEEAQVKGNSRTGHTAVMVSKRGLLLVGGRQWDAFQFVTWPGLDLRVVVPPPRALLPCHGEPVDLPGLRYHAMELVKSGVLLIHGGQNFKARDNVSSSTWIVKIDKKSIFTQLAGSSPVPRYGHKLMVAEDGNFMVVGGFSDQKRVKFVTSLRRDEG